MEEGGSPGGGGVKHAAQHGLSHHRLPGQKSHPPLIPIFTPTLTTPPSHPHSSPSASAPEDVPGPWRPGPRVSLSPYGSCRCSHAGRDSAAWGQVQVQVQLQVEGGRGVARPVEEEPPLLWPGVAGGRRAEQVEHGDEAGGDPGEYQVYSPTRKTWRTLVYRVSL